MKLGSFKDDGHFIETSLGLSFNPDLTQTTCVRSRSVKGLGVVRVEKVVGHRRTGRVRQGCLSPDSHGRSTHVQRTPVPSTHESESTTGPYTRREGTRLVQTTRDLFETSQTRPVNL